MPGCRRSIPNSTLPVAGHGLRLSHYILSGRRALRPCNDNRRIGAPRFWHWAAAIGVAPLVSIALILTMMR